jgi:hypothetical protein
LIQTVNKIVIYFAFCPENLDGSHAATAMAVNSAAAGSRHAGI